MGSHKSISSSATPSFPAPLIPDFHVTGTLSPDSTCNYYYVGIYMGFPYYIRTDGLYFIYYDTGELYWYITPILGEPLNGWFKPGPLPDGFYLPVPPYTGIATVSAGGH